MMSSCSYPVTSTHCTQGTTELTLQPLSGTGKVWKINLNCKQCRVLHISVNDVHTASFSYADATLRVTPVDSKKYVTLSVPSFIWLDWFKENLSTVKFYFFRLSSIDFL